MHPICRYRGSRGSAIVLSIFRALQRLVDFIEAVSLEFSIQRLFVMNPNSQHMRSRRLRHVTRYLFWPLFFISHLLAFSLLAWHLLAQISFAYPYGYKLLNIQQQVEEFAPQNRYKAAFEYTKPEEHWAIFRQIVDAIQSHGEGLADITYGLPDGSRTPFMHEAEVIHLQDVANLVDTLYAVGIAAAVCWLLLCFIAYKYKLLFPAVRKVLLGFFAAIVGISVLILGVGATQVFYWFHTKIFPDGHQWFFYYEESLMTTLMKAPDIFGFIALLLLCLITVFWIISLWALHKLLTAHYPRGVPTSATTKDPEPQRKKAKRKK